MPTQEYLDWLAGKVPAYSGGRESVGPAQTMGTPTPRRTAIPPSRPPERDHPQPGDPNYMPPIPKGRDHPKPGDPNYMPPIPEPRVPPTSDARTTRDSAMATAQAFAGARPTRATSTRATRERMGGRTGGTRTRVPGTTRQSTRVRSDMVPPRSPLPTDTPGRPPRGFIPPRGGPRSGFGFGSPTPSPISPSPRVSRYPRLASMLQEILGVNSLGSLRR